MKLFRINIKFNEDKQGVSTYKIKSVEVVSSFFGEVLETMNIDECLFGIDFSGHIYIDRHYLSRNQAIEIAHAISDCYCEKKNRINKIRKIGTSELNISTPHVQNLLNLSK